MLLLVAVLRKAVAPLDCPLIWVGTVNVIGVFNTNVVYICRSHNAISHWLVSAFWVLYDPDSKAKSYNLATPISDPAAPTCPASITLPLLSAGPAICVALGLPSDPTLSLLKLIVLVLLNPKVGDPLTLFNWNEGPNPKLIDWFFNVFTDLGLTTSKLLARINST